MNRFDAPSLRTPVEVAPEPAAGDLELLKSELEAVTAMGRFLIGKAEARATQAERERDDVKAGLGSWPDMVEDLSAGLEAAEARGSRASAALQTVQVLMESAGYWRNAAGYQTDAALWIERALQELSFESNRNDGASPQNNEPSK